MSKYISFPLYCLFCTIFVLVGCHNEQDLSDQLAGQLILDTQDNGIISYDLESRTATTLYASPERYLAWVWELDATPITNQIVLAYTPPLETNRPRKFDRSGLYLLPITGGEPEHLVGGDKENEYYRDPSWSADGNFIFYVRDIIETMADKSFKRHYYLERLNIETGHVDLLAERVVWPRVNNTDDKVVYVSYDDQLDQFGLETANADGTGQKVLIDLGEFGSISTPMFSHDDKSVYFTAGVKDETVRSLFDQMMGVQVAFAHLRHEVESYWWRIPADGGTPEQITPNKQNIWYSDFSPVSDHIAYTITTGGLYVTHLDGTNQEILPEDTIYRTIAWLP